MGKIGSVFLILQNIKNTIIDIMFWINVKKVYIAGGGNKDFVILSFKTTSVSK